MLVLLFSPPDSRGRLVAAPIPGSLIMNHHRHLPLFIVVRLHLIYRHDSRAYYSCFLFHLRIYYSVVRFRFVFYRLAFVPFRKPIDKIHIVTLWWIKSRFCKAHIDHFDGEWIAIVCVYQHQRKRSAMILRSVLIIIKQMKWSWFQALGPSGNCVSSWTQRWYISDDCLSFFNSFPVLLLFPRALPGEIDIIFRRRGGDYHRREDGRGRWHRGGSGVLQREIPSITPWASYIRDYFSFLSASLFFLHLSLYLTFFALAVLFWRASRFPATSGVSFKRRRGRGFASAFLSFLFFFFFFFLRNCGKLAARRSVLRYVTRREKRGEKRIVCRRG